MPHGKKLLAFSFQQKRYKYIFIISLFKGFFIVVKLTAVVRFF